METLRHRASLEYNRKSCKKQDKRKLTTADTEINQRKNVHSILRDISEDFAFKKFKDCSNKGIIRGRKSFGKLDA